MSLSLVSGFPQTSACWILRPSTLPLSPFSEMWGTASYHPSGASGSQNNRGRFSDQQREGGRDRGREGGRKKKEEETRNCGDQGKGKKVPGEKGGMIPQASCTELASSLGMLKTRRDPCPSVVWGPVLSGDTLEVGSLQLCKSPQEIPLRAGHLPLVRVRVTLEHSYALCDRPPQKTPFIYQITCFFGQEVGRGQLPLHV